MLIRHVGSQLLATGRMTEMVPLERRRLDVKSITGQIQVQLTHNNLARNEGVFYQ